MKHPLEQLAHSVLELEDLVRGVPGSIMEDGWDVGNRAVEMFLDDDDWVHDPPEQLMSKLDTVCFKTKRRRATVTFGCCLGLFTQVEVR